MIKYSIEKHAQCFVTKVLASTYGAHIFNIELSAPVDNGSILAKGAMKELDLYADDGTLTGFEAEVVAKAANGNYYVEVKAPGNALLVYQQPMISEEWTNSFKKISNFYNEKGDVVRSYQLSVGDLFEVSAEAFSVPGDAAVGKTITTTDATTHKMILV